MLILEINLHFITYVFEMASLIFSIEKAPLKYCKLHMENTTCLKTAVLGFGNPVRSDDAIGVYVANELKRLLSDREDVSVFDMGTSAFEILFQLNGHQRIIVVDGVLNSGEEDGTLFHLPVL